MDSLHAIDWLGGDPAHSKPWYIGYFVSWLTCTFFVQRHAYVILNFRASCAEFSPSWIAYVFRSSPTARGRVLQAGIQIHLLTTSFIANISSNGNALLRRQQHDKFCNCRLQLSHPDHTERDDWLLLNGKTPVDVRSSFLHQSPILVFSKVTILDRITTGPWILITRSDSVPHRSRKSRQQPSRTGIHGFPFLMSSFRVSVASTICLVLCTTHRATKTAC